MALALNNQQSLVFHKTKKPNLYSFKSISHICLLSYSFIILLNSFYIFYFFLNLFLSSTYSYFFRHILLSNILKQIFLKSAYIFSTARIGLHVNAHKTEYMCFNQIGDISTLSRSPLKLVDKFIYLGNSVSSTEADIDSRLTRAWTAIDKQSVIWKSDLTDKIKRSFFQAGVVSILLHGCTTWTLTKRMEKTLDSNYTIIMRAILNKFWRQHPTKPQLYGHLPPITKAIQV